MYNKEELTEEEIKALEEYEAARLDYLIYIYEETE